MKWGMTAVLLGLAGAHGWEIAGVLFLQKNNDAL